MSNSLAEELTGILEEGLDVLESEASEKDEPETNTGCSFTDILIPLGKAMDSLDGYTKSRVLQSIGRSLLGGIGWTRAYKDSILYGSYELALSLQGGEKDETGVFIGAYGEQELTPDGTPITSLLQTLTPYNLERLEQQEDKEDLIWNAYDKAEEAYRDNEGDDNAVFFRPTRNERAKGIRSPGEFVEDQAAFALNWYIERERERQKQQDERSRTILKFSAQERAKRRAERYIPVVK